MKANPHLVKLPPSKIILPFDETALPEIVYRYLNGESMAEIGRDYDRAGRTLYRFMLSGMGEELWKQAQTDCMIVKISEADRKLEAAATAVDVKKYEALGKFARMDFERRRPVLYGQKREVHEKRSVRVFVNRDGKHEELLPPKQRGEIIDISGKAG